QKFTTICNQFICQLFSSKCQLTTLQLDISKDNSVFQIHKCLSSSSDIISNLIDDNQLVIKCITLRRLHVHLGFGYFIEHVSALEVLSVIFRDSLAREWVNLMKIEKFTSTVISWYDKVSKLKYFILKSKIHDYSKFVYLKWILNNINHIETFKFHLDINLRYEQDLTKRYCLIDANFISRYCMTDTWRNLIDFNFYIISKYPLLLNNISTIENSFKNHKFFIKYG
ncbi:unnamed protein product, partial [Rotaria sp. Silwood1]